MCNERQAAAALHHQEQLARSHLELPVHLRECCACILTGLQRLLQATVASCKTSGRQAQPAGRHAHDAASQPDAVLEHMLAVLHKAWEAVSAPGAASADPLFLFRDGPITTAAKLGRTLLLEDLDVPCQAIVERMNPMIETEPSFAVSEDPTATCSAPGAAASGGGGVALLPSMLVLATVRLASGAARVGLSPAARSRFTEVHVAPYGDVELRAAVKQEVEANLSTAGPPPSRTRSKGSAWRWPAGRGRADTPGGPAEALVSVMWQVRQAALARPDQTGSDQAEVHRLFRWAAFVARHSTEHDLARRVLVGAQYFYFGHLKNQVRLM